MQYACGVQCDPVCNHGSERISFWRQLYKPSAPLRVLLSALKASFAIHQLFAGGLSQLLLLCIHTPPPGCSPVRFAVPGRSCLLQHALRAGCAISSRKGYAQSHLLFQYASMASIFLSHFFLHLTQVNPLIICLPLGSNPTSASVLLLALHLPASPGTLQEPVFKDHSFSPRPNGQPKNKEEWTTFQGNSTAESPPSKNASSCLQKSKPKY